MPASGPSSTEDPAGPERGLRGRQLRLQIRTSFLRFFQAEASGGVLLILATTIALVLANSRLAPSYAALWEHPVGLGRLWPGLSVQEWINDGLMAAFFLLVGLEIKRELLQGELASLRKAALPAVAALGGMVAPGVIYYLVTRGSDATRGWGIPTATDIAFTVGVLTLLGRRVPLWIKVFVTALAIVDDLGAVVLIAVFYTRHLSLPALLVVGLATGVLVLLNRRGTQRLAPYLLVFVVLWAAMLRSGVHATLAGVILGMCVPLGREPLDASPLHRLEHALHVPTAFFIVPLFALANAGVTLPLSHAGLLSAAQQPAPLGVMLGLFIGKPLGIFVASFAAVKLGIGALPSRGSFAQLLGAAMLAGIGFTMSIFIAGLAFQDERLTGAKLGILLGSLASAVLGATFLRVMTKEQEQD